MSRPVVFIYGLVDPRTESVRYVGKSVDPLSRFAAHLRDQTSTRRGRWIRSLLDQGLRPELMLLEAVAGDWREAERRWIAAYRAADVDLTNHTDGGEGVSGLDAEARGRLSAAMTQRLADPQVRAKIYTPERAAAISKSLKGRSKPASVVALMPQNQRGYRFSDEHNAKLAVAATGRPMPATTRAALAKANAGNTYGLGNQSRRGQVVGPDELAARSLKLKGVPKTDAHRQRIAEGQRRAWALRREQLQEGSR